MQIIQNLEEAEKILRITTHILNNKIPGIDKKKYLLNLLLKINTAITKIINSILQYEYLQGEINLTQNKGLNLKIFLEKCSKKYQITQKEKKEILKVIKLIEKHNKSPFEFRKKEEIIILSEKSKPEIFNEENIKQFLELGKNILKKTIKRIKNP